MEIAGLGGGMERVDGGPANGARLVAIIGGARAARVDGDLRLGKSEEKSERGQD